MYVLSDHNIFFWGTNEFEVSLEKRIMLIGLLGAEMWSFEVQKFGNFAHLSTFGFFFINFFGRSDTHGNPEKPIFQKNSFFEGCNGFMMPKMHSWGVWNILKIFWFLFFIFPSLLENFLHSFWNLLAKNDPIMASSSVRETVKKPNFEKISFFEGCDGSRMPKMHF